MDDDVRRLERAWRASGAVDDEAAWLKARQRTGDLELDRCRVAALCGHAAALVLLEGTPICVCGIAREGAHVARCPSSAGPPLGSPQLLRIPRSLNAWARAFQLQDEQALGRAFVSVARLAAASSTAIGQASARALSMVEDYLACPCEPHGEALSEGRHIRSLEGLASEGPGRVVHHALWAAVTGFSSTAPTPPGERLAYAVAALREQTTERAIRDEVVPWALGYSDPLRERVEGRC